MKKIMVNFASFYVFILFEEDYNKYIISYQEIKSFIIQAKIRSDL